MVEALELDLVFVRLLLLLTTDDALELARLARLADDGRLVDLLLLLGERAGGLGGLLLVVAVLVTPLDVLRCRLLEVLLDVVERVLGDVRHAEVRVLLDATRVREGLAREKFDESRLSGAIGADDTDAGRERDGARDVVELGLLGARVAERAVGHLEDRARLGAHAHERAGRRERELDDRGREGVVRLSGRVLLDELGKVALVVDELLLLVVDDVGADGVKEATVVRDDHRGDVVLRVEV